MNGIALVMPMAGRGSRFTGAGIVMPKPLIEIAGRPFFWWAAESVRRRVPVREQLFVVLAEHCAAFDLDRRILAWYPAAKIVRIADVTSGAAETARLGLRHLSSAGPVAINDCDHAFECETLAELAQCIGAREGPAAALLCFGSRDPAYSYAMLDEAGRITGTVEKQVVSPHAIAGCYLFADASVFLGELRTYERQCPYAELFISGICNQLAQRGRLSRADLGRHWSFGTPDELRRVRVDELVRAFA